jgi:hypothetical protein
MPLVARTKSPRTPLEVALDLLGGHVAAFAGAAPTLERLGMGWAQIALENARGAALYGFNYGNITAGGDWKNSGKDYNEIKVDERLDIVHHPDQWTNITLAFRVYPSSEEGAAGYWNLLSGRYKSVLPIFDQANVHDAAYRLSQLGYYTARPEDHPGPNGTIIPGYASTMAKLYNEFVQHIRPQLPTVIPHQKPVCADPDCTDDKAYGYIPEEMANEVMAENAVSLWEQTGEFVELHHGADDGEANS